MRNIGWGRRIVAGALALGALGLAMLAAGASFQAQQFDRGAVELDAIVVQLAVMDGESASLAPVFAFQLPGLDHVSEVRGSTGTSPPSYAKGERAAVRVNPADPQQVYGPKDDGPWFLARVTGTLGIMLALASYGVATSKPSGGPLGRRLAVVMLDVWTSYVVFGVLIAAAMGRLTWTGFDRHDFPVLTTLACVTAYLVLGRQLPGGTVWQRILRTRARAQGGTPGPT